MWEIQPARSRLLAVWCVGVHALALASVALSGLAWPLKLAAGAALLAHAALRRPPAPTPIRRHDDGTWSVPALGLERLSLRAGTVVGPFWIRLALGSADATAATVLLLSDQVDREAWRRLQAELRRRTEPGTL